MSKEKLVTLRFVDHIVDENGKPQLHLTKQGELARNGGKIPLIQPDGTIVCKLPGDVFEVSQDLADDLMGARPGVIVLESDYQKRAVRIESARAVDDMQRFVLSAQFTQDKATRAAQTRLLAQLEKKRREDLRAAVAELETAPTPAGESALMEQLAKMEKRAEEREKAAADRIAALEDELRKRAEAPKAQDGPAPVATTEKPAEPKAKKAAG